MPYAAKAKIQHKYESGTLLIWITFHLPMRIYSGLYMSGGPYDEKPPDAKWIVKLDTVETAITSSEWLDLFTMLLTITGLSAEPNKVTVQYDGPDEKLCWIIGKQWEPWAAIESYSGFPSDFKIGMILLWSGSIVSIPTGWHLCDGDEGTPDLRNNFVVGAGDSHSVDDTGGSELHAHGVTLGNHEHNISPGTGLAAGTNKKLTTDVAFLTGSTDEADGLPPYYALAYIMKL
jgi:hypothetical protein